MLKINNGESFHHSWLLLPSFLGTLKIFEPYSTNSEGDSLMSKQPKSLNLRTIIIPRIHL